MKGRETKGEEEKDREGVKKKRRGKGMKIERMYVCMSGREGARE